jgi:hypothetical protein
MTQPLFPKTMGSLLWLLTFGPQKVQIENNSQMGPRLDKGKLVQRGQKYAVLTTIAAAF